MSESFAETTSIESSKFATICKFFNRERGCRFGDKCRYRHELEILETTQNVHTSYTGIEEESTSVSKFLGKSEISNSGQKVLASEKGKNSGRDDQKQDGATQNKKRQTRKPVCRYFRKNGSCRDGDECRFFHQTNVAKSECSLSQPNVAMPAQTPEQTEIVATTVTSKEARSHNLPKAIKRPENLSEKLSELTDEGVTYLQAVEIEQLKKRFGNGDLKITQEDHGTVCMFAVKPTDPDWPYDINEIELNATFPNNYPKEIFRAEVTDDDGQFPANFLKFINGDIGKHLQEHAEAQKLRDSPDLLFRPFLRWLDRNLENLFTKALKQIKFDVEARSAGLEFITFDTKDASNNKTDYGNEESEIEIQETSYQEFNEDSNQECENITAGLGAAQISNDGDGGGNEENTEARSEMFEMIEAKKYGNSKKGTEIRLRGMDLHENTATVRITSLTLTVQCSRCKNREEMANVKEKTQVVIPCSKCSNAQSIVFSSAELVHQHSATLAYINPQSCLPVDLILTECQLVLGCLNCSKETSVKGINYGSTKCVWCRHCHNKLDLKVEAARFHQLQPAEETDGKIKTVELKKPSTKTKDPLIKSGQALPDKGTCKHYKKSYRWMRFPCCGKCYPCDKCHEEASDGHEMEQATRMICGFCSKEQVFSQKGCVSCKASMIAIHTSHWEGGRGCRSKIKMSRGDDKKYSDKNKTVSKHAIKVEGQKKK